MKVNFEYMGKRYKLERLKTFTEEKWAAFLIHYDTDLFLDISNTLACGINKIVQCSNDARQCTRTQPL